MPTYTPADLERIASASGVPVSLVVEHAQRLESAATWLRLDRGEQLKETRKAEAIRRHRRQSGHNKPGDADSNTDIQIPPILKERTPSAQRKALARIASSAARLQRNLEPGATRATRREQSLRTLLNRLTITNPDAAEDGPGDPEILHLLTFPEGSTEDYLLDLVWALVAGTLEQQSKAAAELERLAGEAAIEVTRLGDLTVPKGHPGDRAINEWIATMLAIYRAITGREPGTAVDPVSGIATGYLIQFLSAAAGPVGIRTKQGQEFSEDAWRSRIRTVLASAD